MARLILTTPGEDVDIGGNVDIVGTRSGGEVITLMRGDIALDASFNAGGDTIVLPDTASSYTARLVGSQVLIENGTLSVLIPVGTAGIEIQFPDTSLNLAINTANNTVMLGDQTLTTTAQPVDPQPAQSTTPVMAETSGSNNTPGTAQPIDRDDLAVAPNTLLDDDSLESISISGSLSSNTDTDFFSIYLEEGELLVLDIDGASTGLDTVLNVQRPGGAELTSNDDGQLDPGSNVHPNSLSMTLDSFVSFRAPASGTYTFSVDSYRDDTNTGSSGQYQLRVSVGPPAPVAQIIAEDVDNLWSGERWFDTDLTYGFPTDPSQYGSSSSSETGNNFESFNPLQRQATGQMLDQFAAVSNLTFTLLEGNPGDADLRYAMSDQPATAYAYYPSSAAVGGDSWYNNSSGTYNTPVAGGYAWFTILHETGHAMGLKHGHEAPALSIRGDTVEYTVMSYRSYSGAGVGPDDGGYKIESWGFPTTLMMYDIAALQKIYGANFGHESGSTIYTWDHATGQMSINGVGQFTPGGNRVFMTVWDGGGEDTYDLSNYDNGVIIDLRPGEWTVTSDVQLANLGDGNYAAGNVANALLFNGDERSLIENAKGGDGADRFIANGAANDFTGAAGADTFVWHSAEDSAVGEADRVLDFRRGTDMLDLSAIDANENVAGDQDFQFIGLDDFSNTAGELRYEVSGGALHLLADVNGDGAADLEILLVNLTTISTADFHG